MTWVKTPEEVPNARRVKGLWITLKRQTGGLGYAGAMPFDLWIDPERKMGYKKLTEQVNHMDKAVRGHVDLSSFTREELDKIGEHLKTIRPDLWENASEAFKDGLTS
jgi:hypothetical protein